MFTGIIEELGSIRSISKGTDHYQLTISAAKVLEDVQLGDSIAVNGICLTVTSFSKQAFTADVMPETIKATSLQQLGPGSYVNLERAMAAGERFGGHFVSGHVDTVGTIKKRELVANSVYFSIDIDPRFSKFIVPKGSICIDGISLTVFDAQAGRFTISIIPHTLSETVLQFKQVGDIVNIECDMLAKYIDKLLDLRETPAKGSEALTLEKLAEHGYI